MHSYADLTESDLGAPQYSDAEKCGGSRLGRFATTLKRKVLSRYTSSNKKNKSYDGGQPTRYFLQDYERVPKDTLILAQRRRKLADDAAGKQRRERVLRYDDAIVNRPGPSRENEPPAETVSETDKHAAQADISANTSSSSLSLYALQRCLSCSSYIADMSAAADAGTLSQPPPYWMHANYADGNDGISENDREHGSQFVKWTDSECSTPVRYIVTETEEVEDDARS
ncbi:uncharacterized protein V1518DRAFT_407392 [Limtongia smithiae]|uniref:uncharacterized protein n=1 Tax=Limtongia smithiae TaxID=1125753 RepID=UPI0034D020C9